MLFRRTDSRVEELRSLDVLAGLTSAELRAIATKTTAVSFHEGEALCRQGTQGDQVFFLLSGAVAVLRDDLALGTIGAGGVVGEMAVLDGTTRSATAIARTRVQALVLTVQEFRALLLDYPLVAGRLRVLNQARRGELALV